SRRGPRRLADIFGQNTQPLRVQRCHIIHDDLAVFVGVEQDLSSLAPLVLPPLVDHASVHRAADVGSPGRTTIEAGESLGQPEQAGVEQVVADRGVGREAAYDAAKVVELGLEQFVSHDERRTGRGLDGLLGASGHTLPVSPRHAPCVCCARRTAYYLAGTYSDEACARHPAARRPRHPCAAARRRPELGGSLLPRRRLRVCDGENGELSLWLTPPPLERRPEPRCG